MNTTTPYREHSIKPPKTVLVLRLKEELSNPHLAILLTSCFLFAVIGLLMPFTTLFTAYLDWHKPHLIRADFWFILRFMSVFGTPAVISVWRAFERVPAEEK
jgi:hypothetical protein